MAKTVQIHICHILASIGWHLLWPWCQNNIILQKKLGFSFFSRSKKGEGSLHPRPKGRSIRDPPHSLCNKNNVTKSEVLEAFKESQDRVTSMALIHEQLHKSEDTDTLNFSSYIEELADNLFLTYRLGNENIRFSKDIEEDVFFDIDVSIPLGLILNELISNSFKYAFPNKDNGEIRVTLCRNESGISDIENSNTVYVLSVSDNGVGIPTGLDIENLDSLGLQLVTTLIDQLDGELELKRDNGTEFIIRFSVREE